MKHLLTILTLAALLTACGLAPGHVTGTVSDGTPPPTTPQASPPPPIIPPPIIPPPIIPPPVICQTFVGNVWIADGPATLTSESVDQTNSPVAYIEELDLRGANPTFTETQFQPPAGAFICTRNWNDATSFGFPLSLVWPDNTGIGNCAITSTWIQFDNSQCNKVTALFRTRTGAVYLTQNYKPGLP